MPMVPVPLIGAAYQNLDETELDVRSIHVRNLFVNEANHSVKRPGLAAWVDLGTGRSIDALYWWDKQQVLLAVSNGHVWKITDALGTATQLSTTDTLQIGEPTTIDDNGTTACFANGGRILTTTLAGPATYLADADAPTTVTHLGFIDQYLAAAVTNSGSFQISEVGELTAWRALDVATAETKPDDIKALHVGLGEIVLFGSRSIEFWVNDGVSPFSRIKQATIERGIAAKHSVALVGDSWFCLDNRRKVIEIRGRQPTEVSQAVDNTIQGMVSVERAIGRVYTIEGLPLYVLSFPQDGRTLVYNFQKRDWAEWDYWDTTEATERRYRGNAYAYAEGWNLHLVGDYQNGKIYNASSDTYQDDSASIRCRRRTGFITHNTLQRKESIELRFRVKQSVATPTSANPQMMVRYRDHGGAWGRERWVNLGPVGDHELSVALYRNGTYRARQYEIAFTDDAPFILTGAEEMIEVLG